MQKRWVVADTISQTILDQFSHIDPLIVQLLHNRGMHSQDAIDEFLAPDYDAHIHDPFLFDDMERAVRRIILAIETGELIIIYGDYDVDGICASTVLFDTLTLLGANVDVYLPHREKEGYGLRTSAIQELAGRNVKVIITNDSGISNKAEVEFANTLNINVIITDHHHAPEREEDLPPAFAIIHPRVHADQYPFKYLAGVGSAFKLVQALIHADFDPAFTALKDRVVDNEGVAVNWDAYEKWLLDIVCIATITDCMPLRGENRTIVKYGLMVLNKTRRKGLRALLKSARREGKPVDIQTIGFYIGPRINAASRMDHASVAFRLMTAGSDDSAMELAAQLEQTNSERQKLSERVTNEAMAAVKERFEENKKILIAHGEHWPIGVLGLVAGRVMGKYHRPVVLVTTSVTGHRDGTARSVAPFNVAEAFGAHPHFFTRFGGHAMAGGFALNAETDFDEFRTALEEYAENHINVNDLVPLLKIDARITLDQMQWKVWELLDKFGPFGQENPSPNFMFSGIRIVDLRPVGKNNKHLKLTVQQNGRIKRAIAFSFGSLHEELKPGDLVDIVGEMSVNEWNGVRDLELSITDIHHVACTLTPPKVARTPFALPILNPALLEGGLAT